MEYAEKIIDVIGEEISNVNINEKKKNSCRGHGTVNLDI